MKESFSEFINNRKKDYRTWSPIFSPALREYVFFPLRGFNHLRFKTDNTPRKPMEAKYKLGLLPLVPPVIHRATKVDQYERRLAPVGGSRKRVLKEIEYWSLIAVVGKRDVKTKVVLRKVGKGNIHFWSVMKLAENQKTPSRR